MNTADTQYGDDHISASTAQPFPRIELRFSHPGRGYDPGEWVTVEYSIEGLNGERPRALERSVLWYTEGKGEEDLGVHSFERFATAETIDRVVPEGTFAIQVPTSPLSYEGVIVKIRWCIRLRVFFESGRDHVSEHVFNVGRVPPSILP
jgi:hypothetical protein